MSSHESNDGAVHVHVASAKLYGGILGALLLLTALTVAVYQVHLGAANLAIAVLIATLKASLVVLFFMHLKDDSRFNALVFIGALLFMGLFLAYTVADVEYRGSVDPQYATKVDPATGKAAGGMDESLREELVRRAQPQLPAAEGRATVPELPVPALEVVPQVAQPTPVQAADAADGGAPALATEAAAPAARPAPSP